MRDINLESTIYPRFTTRAFATGIPTTLGGTPVLSVYEENNLTQITAGVSVTVDYDSMTGLNQATIVATAANGYEAGKSYDLVITTGTVGGVSVVGEVVYSFTIEDSAAGLSATARSNLEDQYDTTGLTGDTFPATQAQLDQLTVAGAAVHVAATAAPGGFTMTTGSEVNDEDSTQALDGTRHELSDSAGTLDCYYIFDIGGDGLPTSATIKSVINSTNDTFGIYVNTGSSGTPVWSQRGTITGSGSSNNITNTVDLFLGDTLSDDVSAVWVRINGTGLTSSSFDVDQIFVSKSVVNRTVGYADGAVWIDTNASNTNTESYVDGTADNPVSTIAAANTIATNLGLKRFRVAANSSITFAASQENQQFSGEEWTLALGGQSIAGTQISGAVVSGVGTGTGHHFLNSNIGNVSLEDGSMGWCMFTGTITLTGAGDSYWHDCYSGVAGSGTPVVDFGALVGNSNLNVRRYSGGLQIDNKDATGTDLMSLEGNGQLVVSASSGGAISLRGNFKVTNTGGATITYDDNSQGIKDIETDTDELQTDLTDGGRLDLLIDAILADTASGGIVKNAAFDNFEFPMVLTSDHYTAATGKTVTATRSIDGGAFGAASGSVAEVGSGVYQIDLLAADTNGDTITYKFSATDCDDTIITVITRS